MKAVKRFFRYFGWSYLVLVNVVLTIFSPFMIKLLIEGHPERALVVALTVPVFVLIASLVGLFVAISVNADDDSVATMKRAAVLTIPPILVFATIPRLIVGGTSVFR